MTGYEWHHVAADLAEDHRVIVPDYRGAGASSTPEGAYDNATMARDLIAVLDADIATDLVADRQAAFFEHFYHGFAGRPDRIPRTDRDFYAAAFDSRERLRAGFRIYEAFEQSGAFFAATMPAGGVAMPAFVLGGEVDTGAFVQMIASDMGADRTKVLDGVGHFIPEEAPEEFLTELRAFWREIEGEA